MCLRLIALMFTFVLVGCDAGDPYRRGFDAGRQEGRRQGYTEGLEEGRISGTADGEKTGRETGFAQGHLRGRVEGYAAGTVKMVGAGWRPSVALGTCVGLALTALWGCWLLTRPLVAMAAAAVHAICGAAWRFCSRDFIARRNTLRIDRLRSEEAAANECQARLLVVAGLRSVQRSVTDERLQAAVEAFLRESSILQEFDAQLDLAIQAARGAQELILRHPRLSARSRLELLRQLSGQLLSNGSGTPPATASAS